MSKQKQVSGKYAGEPRQFQRSRRCNSQPSGVTSSFLAGSNNSTARRLGFMDTDCRAKLEGALAISRLTASLQRTALCRRRNTPSGKQPKATEHSLPCQRARITQKVPRAATGTVIRASEPYGSGALGRRCVSTITNSTSTMIEILYTVYTVIPIILFNIRVLGLSLALHRVESSRGFPALRTSAPRSCAQLRFQSCERLPDLRCHVSERCL